MDTKWGYMSSAHVLGDFDGYHRLLCALSYKHNNQHRRSPWWMALQTFKRQLLDLIRDMQDLQRLLDQTTTKRRNSIHEGQTTRLHTTKLEREKVWKEWFIEHWAMYNQSLLLLLKCHLLTNILVEPSLNSQHQINGPSWVPSF